MAKRPRNDPRFGLHSSQPRTAKLTRKLLAIARRDDAFAQAMVQRAKNPERVRAWLAGRRSFRGHPCPKCGGTERLCYAGDCKACSLRRNAALFGTNASGKLGRLPYAAQRSMTSRTDRKERREAARRAGPQEYRSGPWRAVLYPDGRIALTDFERCGHWADFTAAWRSAPQAWGDFAARDKHLTALLRDQLGW